MEMIINADKLHSLDQIAAFPKGTHAIVFGVVSTWAATYQWIHKTRAQVNRLIRRYCDTDRLRAGQRTLSSFAQRDTDIRLLIDMGERCD